MTQDETIELSEARMKKIRKKPNPQVMVKEENLEDYLVEESGPINLTEP